jgi:hypothetical protein
MAKNSGQRRLDGALPPAPSGGRIGPRRLLPVPANDNRLPGRVRLRRGLMIAATVVVGAWALVELVAAAF